MLKKSSILLSSYGNIYNTCNVHPACSNPPASPQPPRPVSRCTAPPHRLRQQSQRRNLAEIRPEKQSSSLHDLEWPKLASANDVPTPYQIFKQKKGTPYSKRRFYELVKIYHPDKHCHVVGSSEPETLSQTVKLERYRLVVAANDILSDPVRRKAYDRNGAGWDDQLEIGMSRQHWRHSHGRGWSGFDDNASPARNATWEDWEKWYQRDTTRRKPKPLFFSNGGFVMVLMLCSVLGGMGEINRARQFSGSFLEQLEAVHDQSSKDLQRRRKESQGFIDKDARVQSFLKTRDPVGYGVTDPQEEGYQRLLPDPEICMSGDIQARGT